MNNLILPDNHELAIRMLLDKIPKDLIPSFGSSVLHIGTHTGEEVPFYLDYGFSEIYLIEANPDIIDILLEKFSTDKRIHIFNFAICNRTGFIDLIVHQTKKGGVESSSILNLKELGDIVPTFDSSKKHSVQCTTIDAFIVENNLQKKIDLLTIDIQGAELFALLSASKFLKTIKAVICEVNLIENYENCPLEIDIDKYLTKMGLDKVFSIYHELYKGKEVFPAWGECLWVNGDRG